MSQLLSCNIYSHRDKKNLTELIPSTEAVNSGYYFVNYSRVNRRFIALLLKGIVKSSWYMITTMQKN